MSDDQPDPTRPRDKQDAELSRMIRQEKAEAALRAFTAGGDLTAETFALANEFTDGVTESLGRRIRRLFRR